MARILKWIGIVLVGLIVLAVAGAAVAIAVVDWKGLITSRASAALGREVAIDGPLSIDWSLSPRLHAERVRLANAPWSRDPNMVEIAAVDVGIALPDLLLGRLHLPEIRLRQPKVILERNGQGEPNWQLGTDQDEPTSRSSIPVVDNLVIEEGLVVYRDPVARIDVASRISTALGTGGGSARTELAGQGSFGDQPFSLTVAGGSLLDLREPKEPFPVRLDAAVGDTRGKVEGTVGAPLKLTDFNLTMALSGPDLARLFPIFGIPIPPTPDYALTGRLTHEGAVWGFRDFQGKVGGSDLSGTVTVDTGGERPVIRAELASRRLDAADLGGFVGLGEEEDKRDRLLPDGPFNLDRLRAVDMAVTFNGQELRAPGLPPASLDAKLNLEGGRLALEPLNLGLADGRIGGAIVLDGRRPVPEATIDLKLSGLNLTRFFKGSEMAEDMGGTFGGRIDLKGRGNSVAELLGTSNGKLALVMGGGKVSNLVLELVGIDAAEALGLALSEDQPVAVRCVVADFEVRNGLMRSKALVFDTTDTNVTGEGAVSLKRETLDLTLLAHPKDTSPVSARAPVHISGPWRKPEIGIDIAAVAARGVAAVALGALLTPLAALLPLIETGQGEDSPCGQLIRQANRPAR